MSKQIPEIPEEKILDAGALLAGMKVTKKVMLSSVPGEYVEIRKLSHLDMVKIWSAGEKDQELSATGVILRGLVKPKLSKTQIDGLPGAVTSEIAQAITEYSGLSGEAQERTAAFLEKQKA